MSNQNKDETKVGNNVPNHYIAKSFDVIDVANEFNLNFYRMNVLKYICRAGKKDNELDDLKKAQEYIKREIEYLINKK